MVQEVIERRYVILFYYLSWRNVMNRQNDEKDALNNISNIRREILKLCNAPGTETTDFHKLGFSCLLKKLHEIEKILTGLKDMPINAHSTPHASRCQPVITEPEQPIDRSYQDLRANPASLSLPDDLTPHTKRVLIEIYNKIERSFDDFYENTKLKLKQSLEDNYRRLEHFMSSLRDTQKDEIRMFIENVLDVNGNEVHQDTFFGDISHVPIPQSTQASQRAQMPPPDAPMINMEAVRQTLECPGIDPQLKRQFFANLNGLNDILTEIMEQVDRRCPQPSRTAPTKPSSIPELPPECEQDETQFQPLTCPR